MLAVSLQATNLSMMEVVGFFTAKEDYLPRTRAQALLINSYVMSETEVEDSSADGADS